MHRSASALQCDSQHALFFSSLGQRAFLKSNIFLRQTTFYNSFSSSYWNRTAEICGIRIRKHHWKTKSATQKASRQKKGKRRKMFSQRSEANRTTVGINGGKNYEVKHRISAHNCAENVKMMVHILGRSRPNQTLKRTSDRFGGGTQAKRKSKTNARDKDTSKAYASMALTLSRNNGMSCLKKVLTSVSYPTPHPPHPA